MLCAAMSCVACVAGTQHGLELRASAVPGAPDQAGAAAQQGQGAPASAAAVAPAAAAPGTIAAAGGGSGELSAILCLLLPKPAPEGAQAAAVEPPATPPAASEGARSPARLMARHRSAAGQQEPCPGATSAARGTPAEQAQALRACILDCMHFADLGNGSQNWHKPTRPAGPTWRPAAASARFAAGSTAALLLRRLGCSPAAVHLLNRLVCPLTQVHTPFCS